ncbi:hypothetical protein [Mucilaginibacter sp.]|jgi:hypothetical protein|uniref:hypothetical protein n=1 Tax=Mucilaginibacter sp. TaxID=1882438 RepID=UPI0025F7D375|nr:hypothetical protein [Mucilaginibacter sp.]
MKPILLLFSTLLFANSIFAQKKVNYGVLQKPDEKVLYGFSLKSSNKIVLVCTQKDNKYIVYRFGTKDKAELQYPALLNATSWKVFRYDGYSRSGVNNSPTEIHSLSFKNNNATYEIGDNWDGDENEHNAEVIVKSNGKKTKIEGLASSIDGTLATLLEKDNLIHNYYLDDNK